MNNLIFYKGEDPNTLKKGLNIWVIADPSGCGSCMVAKSKLEILHKSYPDVNFVYWDVKEYNDLEKIFQNGKPIAYPYVMAFTKDHFITSAYSAEVYIIEDMIQILRETDGHNN